MNNKKFLAEQQENKYLRDSNSDIRELGWKLNMIVTQYSHSKLNELISTPEFNAIMGGVNDTEIIEILKIKRSLN